VRLTSSAVVDRSQSTPYCPSVLLLGGVPSQAAPQNTGAGETESEFAAIRQCTHTGRPLGAAEFVMVLKNRRSGGWPTKGRAARKNNCGCEAV
jgi:hypothetical protein